MTASFLFADFSDRVRHQALAGTASGARDLCHCGVDDVDCGTQGVGDDQSRVGDTLLCLGEPFDSTIQLGVGSHDHVSSFHGTLGWVPVFVGRHLLLVRMPARKRRVSDSRCSCQLVSPFGAGVLVSAMLLHS